MEGWWSGEDSTLADLGSRRNICDRATRTYEAIWGGLGWSLGVCSEISGEHCTRAQETPDGWIEGVEGRREGEGKARESDVSDRNGRRTRGSYFEHPTNQKRHEQNSRQASITYFVPKGESKSEPIG